MTKKEKEIIAIKGSLKKWNRALSGDIDFSSLFKVCDMCAYYLEPSGYPKGECVDCALALTGNPCLEEDSVFDQMEKYVCRAKNLKATRYSGDVEYMKVRIEKMISNIEEALRLVEER